MDVQPTPPTRTRLFREVVWHLLFALATVAVLVAGLRLESADIRVPFAYHGDALLILPLVKATIERGSHWANERFGAPGIQELHDFPIVDHLHFGIMWLIGLAVPDPFAVFNLFYLLTYPLTTLSAMFVLRRLGLSVPAAGVGGLLFAFLPYHYLRGQGHYFLAAYYVVPLAVLVMVWICGGRLPFFRREPDGRYRFRPWSADTLAAVLIAAATASGGAYYAFFACALLLFAGCYGWAVAGTWRAFAAAGLVVAVIVAVGVANHAPTFAYQYHFGRNSAPTTRYPEEAEEYGLKLTHLFLPVAGHHSRALAEVRSVYDSDVRPLQTENADATLGLLGSAGLAVLLAAAVLPVRRVWLLGPLSGLAIFAVLLGTIGGLGALFNLLVTPQVRCYNRVSVYIAFLCLAAVCGLMDWAFTGRAAWLRWPTFLALAAFGVWDQTDNRWFTPAFAANRAEVATQFRADAAFYAEVERTMPGGSVFNLPFIPYPETLSVGKLSGYDHARGYLHTDTMRWSFGAMEGREVDLWQREVAAESPDRMLPRIVARGFDALLIDRRGYSPTEADALHGGVMALLGPSVHHVTHPNGQEVVYDLRNYRDRLRTADPIAYEQSKRRELEAVSILWLDGFYSFEPSGREWKHRWCGPRGVAVIVNPTDRTRTFRVDAVVRTKNPEYADLQIDGGPVWTERFPINDKNPVTSHVIVVPPGRHTVRFRCRLPGGHVYDDPRRLTFFIAQWAMTEVSADTTR
ncbi:MAG TPA: hypothetical protein VM533_04765 [Fimbriiglobus sp.]|nr:hypothetical protein [Fimbriiglobus sp.]